MKDVNIYFDEKGPSKSVSISDNLEDQFNFFGSSSDNIPAYVGIYLAIPKSKQSEFDTGFQKMVDDYYANQRSAQAKELKSLTLLKNVTTLADIKTAAAQFYLDLFQLLDDTHSTFQLSAFDKSEVFIAAKLKNWFYYLDRHNLNPYPLLYTITKFLRTEDKYFGGDLTKALNDADLSTADLLNTLKMQLSRVVQKYQGHSRTTRQVDMYRTLIKIIRDTAKIFRTENISLVSYPFPTDQLAYGLDLFVLEDLFLNGDLSAAKEAKDSITILLDDDAPAEGLHQNGFSDIQENLDSKEYPGLQASDFLAGLYGKLIATMDSRAVDPNRPGQVQRMTELFEKGLNPHKKHIDLARATYSHSFGSDSGQYGVMHSTFSDYLWQLQGYLTVIQEESFNQLPVFEKANQHWTVSQELMQQQFYEMNNQFMNIHSLYDSIEDAIEDGSTKPF
ncbi:DUF3800 domain-containing protein [Weissella tructae]|uniref:DUF3800 domain-containing protein n=2 Tax=Weissella TaxID=46255 RepID=A0A075U5T6_9LACO|nr:MULTISPECIES: DUF3800 domain-containing protein [Weissella]AIG65482.1 hypothetical protein WS08_0543 [Weissella tructae]AIM62796.1 hypothetical protein WS74_0544 [Weissella ceti]AIM64131.1 hypothetical protein WS105_0541 [Weissella ceti]ELA07059.1 hypothetical protein WCNC_05747 [Weissella ceti NC36]QVV91855.1 DUF3800 domain-containing protein [Weissella tructae]